MGRGRRRAARPAARRPRDDGAPRGPGERAADRRSPRALPRRRRPRPAVPDRGRRRPGGLGRLLGARLARARGLRDRLVGAAGVPGPRRRAGGDRAGRRPRGRARAAAVRARVPVGRQRAVERDLLADRLHAARPVRLRVSARPPDAVQRLAARPSRRSLIPLVGGHLVLAAALLARGVAGLRMPALLGWRARAIAVGVRRLLGLVLLAVDRLAELLELLILVRHAPVLPVRAYA